VPFDKEAFFQKQIEECRALERQALSTKDRAFWQQAAGRWEEQLRQAQAQPRRSAAMRAATKPRQREGLGRFG
jgi:hypothetical protein